MKYFWALPAALRVALVLAAGEHAFDINDDLLAYPQYEIHYSDQYVTEDFANTQLQHDRPRLRPSVQLSQEISSIAREKGKPPEHSWNEYDKPDEHYYEELVLVGQRYLCAIPDIQPDDNQSSINGTAVKLEQEKELVRANARGWELIAGMKGNCVYYHDGWWSYSYCYDSGARQFHMLPMQKGVAAWPPIEDPDVPGFNLGLLEKADGTRQSSDLAAAQTHGELEVRGGSRYLVQRLEGGDKCDLTTLRRKVEVQFHCSTEPALDYISQVKEVSTCSYLMIIETPRLCNDVAFQPPQKDKPHNITCQPILQSEEVAEYEKELEMINNVRKIAEEETTKSQAKLSSKESEPRWVGDVEIGAHRIVPKGVTIEKSFIVGKEVFVATIATSDGKTMSRAELSKLKLGEPKDIEMLKQKVSQAAKGQKWRLDVVLTIKGYEYRGIHGEDADMVDDNKARGSKGPTKQVKEEASEDAEGSEEEYFKEEL